MVKNNSYEATRQLRMAENLKRMEELNLTALAQKLRTSPKASPMKQSKPRTRKETTLVQVRRSSRVSKLPTPIYKEVAIEVFERTKRRYCGKHRDLSNRVYASDAARAYATDLADDLESKLENGHPSFVKPMLQSHTTGGFWLGLPNRFCKKHLLKTNHTITLIDEEGEEYETWYLAQKTGLSGGWRGFSIAHELVDGDALVFELIKPTKFKVYIIRVNGSNEGEGP